MSIQEFEKWLDGFLNFEKTQKKGIFWLDSVKFLLEKLGNPEKAIPCIHIAGSKGKGSTAKMISYIISAMGKKCGIYTSPHLFDFRERIATAEGLFPNEIYEKAADCLVSCVSAIKKDDLPGKRQLTWFELVTVFAFLCFKNAKVDFVVYETGLGGRLDATNVVLPLASVLVSIEKEHTKFLGNTIEKIAYEKAGIIKDEVPVIVSKQKYKKATEVFEKVAKEKSSPFLTAVLPKNATAKYENFCQIVHFESDFLGFSIDAKMKLLGSFQLQNALTACYAVKTVFPNVKKLEIENGLEKAFLPARFQVENAPKEFPKIKKIIFDGAHTKNSISGTLKTMADVFGGFDGGGKKFDLLFSCASDKDIKHIAPLFFGKVGNVTITNPGYVREGNLKKIAKCFAENNIKADTVSDCKNAFQAALKKANECGAVLLVTGSFYLVGEVF